MNTKFPHTTILSLLFFSLALALGPTDIFAADEAKGKEKGKEKGKAKGEKAGATQLFNGKDLTGWTQKNGTATYRVEDGVIIGRTTEGSPNSFLCTDKTYGDFELEFEVKVDTGLNSGVQIRSKTKEEDGEGKHDAKGRVYGPQVEIESSPGQAGYVYGEATGLGWLSPEPQDKEHAHERMKNDDWNQFRVLARGPSIRTWINGEEVAVLRHPEIYKTHPEGFIGLQVHGIKAGTGPFEVRWRNLKIRELAAAPKEPKK